jgi:hypothetical protein
MIKAGLFHSDGQPFNPDRFKRELQQGIMSQVEHAVRDVECPDHHERATVRRTATGWEIQACCEKLKETTLRALGDGLKRT